MARGTRLSALLSLAGLLSVVCFLQLGVQGAWAPPSDVEATDGTYTSRIEIRWSGSAGAVKYEVSRRASASWWWETIGEATDTNYSDWDVTQCVPYEYRVRAWSGRDWSAYSEPDSGYAGGRFPNPPVAVSASVGQAYCITLTWSASATGISYDVLRSNSQDGQYVLVGTTDLPAWEDAPLPPCSEYWYKVAARNTCGCGLPSVVAGGRSGGPPTPPPVGLAQTASTAVGEARVVWDAVPGAAYYKVERLTLFPYEGLGSTLETAFSVPPPPLLNCGHNDLLAVRACNCSDVCGGAKSLVLDWGEAYMPALKGLAAEQVILADTSPGVRLDWLPLEGADWYEIWAGSQPPDVTNSNPLGEVLAPPFVTGNSDACVTHYWVRACNGSDPHCAICGPLASVEVEGSPVTGAPTYVEATQGIHPTGVLIEWNPVPGATHYEVFRSPLDVQSESLVAWVSGWSTTYWLDWPPGHCQSYSYRVRGCNMCGCGPLTGPAVGYATGVPGEIQAAIQPGADGEPVTLSWDPVERAMSYTVIRQELAPFSVSEQVATLVECHLEDVPPRACRTYIYTIRACNECRCNTSGQLFGSYVDISPTPPISVSATIKPLVSGYYQLSIAWEPVPDAKNYDVSVDGPAGTKKYPYEYKTSHAIADEFEAGATLVITVTTRNWCNYTSPPSAPAVVVVP